MMPIVAVISASCAGVVRPRDEEHRGREADRDQEHRAGGELALDERFAEPVANAAALSPESKRAESVGVGALVMADRLADHRADVCALRAPCDSATHRHAEQHGRNRAAADERNAD